MQKNEKKRNVKERKKKKVKITGEKFRPACQPARTAQADMGRYFLQMY